MSVEFIVSLPESLTQGLLIEKLLIGGLGVQSAGPVKNAPHVRIDSERNTMYMYICTSLSLSLSRV